MSPLAGPPPRLYLQHITTLHNHSTSPNEQMGFIKTDPLVPKTV